MRLNTPGALQILNPVQILLGYRLARCLVVVPDRGRTPYRIPAARNIDDLNGVLGNPLLNDYHVFFDYRGGRFILEPL